MSNIDKLRKVLFKTRERTPYLKANTFRNPKDKETVSYMVTKEMVKQIENFRADFNKLKKDDMTKVLENKNNKELYKIYKISFKTNEYIGFTSSSLYFVIMFNLYTFLEGNKSVLKDLNPDLINTKIELIEYVKPQKGTKKLAMERKSFYGGSSITLTPATTATTIKHATITTKPQNTIEDNYQIYLSLYSDTLQCNKSKNLKMNMYIYIASIDQGKKKYMFYTQKKLHLQKKDKMKEIIKEIKSIKAITTYLSKSNAKHDIMFEKIGYEKVQNSLHMDILIDRYRDIHKPNINSERKLDETSNLSKELNDKTKKNLKDIVSIRINRMLFKNRLYKNEKWLKGKHYIYLIQNNINNNSLISDSKDIPSQIIGNHFDNILNKKKKSKLQQDLSMYTENHFKFKILKVLHDTDDVNKIKKKYKDKYKPKGYDMDYRKMYAIINSKK